MFNLTNKIKQWLKAFVQSTSYHLPALGGALLVVGLTACGSQQPVCQGTPQTVVLAVSTSGSDLVTARALAPQVAAQAVKRAATSCGRLLVGLADNHPEADLVLHGVVFTPEFREAYNRNPQINRLVDSGNAFVETNLLKPLAVAQPTPGGAYLGTLQKIGEELHVHGLGPATIIVVGNGVEEEPAPHGDGTISFVDPPGDPKQGQLGARVREFEPLLAGSLAGSCVMLVGAGANTALSDNAIVSDQALLDEVLAGARVGFVATRSPDLPPACVRPASVRLQPKAHMVVASLNSDVLFELNSSVLLPGAQTALEQLAGSLSKATGLISVSGFADATGDDAINVPLSLARSAAVARWIEDRLGVPASRVRVKGFGSSDPVASNATPEGRALNRRVEIRFRAS